MHKKKLVVYIRIEQSSFGMLLNPVIVAKLRRMLWQATLFQALDGEDEGVIVVQPKSQAFSQTRSDASP